MWRLPFHDRFHRDGGACARQRFALAMDAGGAPEGRVTVAEPRDLPGDDGSAVRQEVAVDICAEQSGYILSVGPMSIWLDGATAEDVVVMLERAIASRGTEAPSPMPPRSARGSN